MKDEQKIIKNEGLVVHLQNLHTLKEVYMKQTINQRNQPLSTSKRDDSISEWIR